MLVIALAWALSCSPVTEARAHGATDQQIEDYAREHHVPEWVIGWAKKHCPPRPLTKP